MSLSVSYRSSHEPSVEPEADVCDSLHCQDLWQLPQILLGAVLDLTDGGMLATEDPNFHLKEEKKNLINFDATKKRLNYFGQQEG